jgi:hypothetical protein
MMDKSRRGRFRGAGPDHPPERHRTAARTDAGNQCPIAFDLPGIFNAMRQRAKPRCRRSVVCVRVSGDSLRTDGCHIGPVLFGVSNDGCRRGEVTVSDRERLAERFEQTRGSGSCGRSSNRPADRQAASVHYRSALSIPTSEGEQEQRTEHHPVDQAPAFTTSQFHRVKQRWQSGLKRLVG